MRILCLTHCVPHPPDKGDRIRAHHQIRHLGSRYSVHLLCLSRTPGDHEGARRALESVVDRVEIFSLAPWRSWCSALLAAASGRPLTVGYFSHRALLRRVRRLARDVEFDLVFATCSSMAPYALAVRGPRVLDLVDADSAKWEAYARIARPPRRWIYGLEARRLRRYETYLTKHFGRVLVTTGREARRLAAKPGVVETVPNGIDCDFFRPAGAPLRQRAPGVVFTGQMDYFPNVDGAVWFARHVVPLLAARVPGVRFVVVGRRPAEPVRRLAELASVSVTGEVADVRPYLERAAVFVAPLRVARGVQNKVLEAMACGVPVVVTSEAAAGLEEARLVAGEDYLVADTAESFRDAVLRLLRDRDAAERIAASARERVARYCDWPGALLPLDDIVRQVATATVPSDRARARGLTSWEEREVAGADP